jgi:hypothetical protein
MLVSIPTVYRRFSFAICQATATSVQGDGCQSTLRQDGTSTLSKFAKDLCGCEIPSFFFIRVFHIFLTSGSTISIDAKGSQTKRASGVAAVVQTFGVCKQPTSKELLK